MNPRLLAFVINLIGGIAVLGSYAHGIATHDQPGTALWGGVPAAIRPVYQLSMLAATAGYLMFTYVLLLHTQPHEVRVAGHGFDLFNVVYLVILIPSALWMPLTFAYLAQPSAALWLAVRGVLLLTGAGAVAMCVALWQLRPAPPLRSLALVGALCFAFQTAVLDALVWPAFFRQN